MQRLGVLLEGQIGTLLLGTLPVVIMQIVGDKVVVLIVHHIQHKGGDHQVVCLPLVLEEPLVVTVFPHLIIPKMVNIQVLVQGEVLIQWQVIEISSIGSKHREMMLAIFMKQLMIAI